MNKRPPVDSNQSTESESVWRDEDDQGFEINIPKKVKKTFKVELKQKDDKTDQIDSEQYIRRLQEAFKRRNGGVPKWAQNVQDEDDEDSLLKSAAGYIDTDYRLPKTSIKTTLLKDFNVGNRSVHSINVVKFHKVRPVLITGDESGRIKLFQTSSEVKKDHFLQSAAFKKFPISCLEITQQGQSVICSSNLQEYLMQYDMESNKFTQMRTNQSIPKHGFSTFSVSHDSQFVAIAGINAHVYIMHATTMEHIKTISLPSNAKSIKFFPGTSREVWIMCETGEVLMSDILSTAQHSFIDDGAVHGTCLTISQHGNYFATGSDTGIVNVYDSWSCRQSRNPKPLFTVDNLVTSISSVVFNSDAQLLATCSNIKDNQIRLVHVQSQTTFKNFPDRHGKVSKAKTIDISPNGGYMAVGNEDGKLHVFNIHHFPNY